MKIIILGSGSKGNSTLLINNDKKILIDVGFSYPKMKKLLEEHNTKPEEIDAILITHTHSDHIGGLKTFAQKNNTKVYTNSLMERELSKIVDNLILYSDNITIGNYKIDIIKTSHDAIGSVGFIIEDNENSLVYVTDTGYINQKYLDKMIDKNYYIMESNHDIEMLMNGPYPYILKQRVLSDKGHLSNELAATYLKKIITKNTKKIILAHLSEINNTETIALETVKNIINDNNIEIICSKQEEALEVII